MYENDSITAIHWQYGIIVLYKLSCAPDGFANIKTKFKLSGYKRNRLKAFRQSRSYLVVRADLPYIAKLLQTLCIKTGEVALPAVFTS